MMGLLFRYSGILSLLTYHFLTLLDGQTQKSHLQRNFALRTLHVLASKIDLLAQDTMVAG